VIKFYSSVSQINDFDKINSSKEFNTKEEAENWAKFNETDYNIIYIVPNKQSHGYIALTKGYGRNK
jgi:hypothetical protein